MLPAKEGMTTIQIFPNLGNNRTAKVRFLSVFQNFSIEIFLLCTFLVS